MTIEVIRCATEAQRQQAEAVLRQTKTQVSTHKSDDGMVATSTITDAGALTQLSVDAAMYVVVGS